METKRFIGNDVIRLYDRVRREFGADAVIVRTRTLMREGADPLVELTAGPAPLIDERIPLDAQEGVLQAALGRLEGEQSRMTVGELEDHLFRAETKAPGAALPDPAPDLAAWVESFANDEDEHLWAPDREADLSPRRGSLPSPRLRLQPIEDVERLAVPEPVWAPRERPAILAHPHHERVRQDSVVELNERRGQPNRATLASELQHLGFAPRAAHLIAESTVAPGVRAAVAEFLAQRSVRHPDDGRTSLITVQGIAGSGRTTALMKMAVDCVDGGTPAVLVAADGSTRDEVYAFGVALGLPVYDASDPADVAMVLGVVPEGACVFADVPPGRWLAPRLDVGSHYAYLAIPADRNPRALTLALAGMNTKEFAGALLTFTDEATSLNPSLSLVIESALGVAFMSDGSDVSTGIRVADPSMLASGVLTTPTRETTDGRTVATA